MTILQPVKQGLSAPVVTSIPDQWSKAWFRSFITNYLTNIDIRNATVGGGISVSGTGGFTQPPTITLTPIPEGTVLGSVEPGENPPQALTQAQLTALINPFTFKTSGAVPAAPVQDPTLFLNALGQFVHTPLPPTVAATGQAIWLQPEDPDDAMMWPPGGGVVAAAGAAATLGSGPPSNSFLPGIGEIYFNESVGPPLQGYVQTSSGAPLVVQEHFSDDAGASGTTMVSPALATARLGSALEVWVSVTGNFTPTSVVDSAGQTYTLLGSNFDAGGGQFMAIYSKTGNTSATALVVTATFAAAQSGKSIWVKEIGGVTAVVDVSTINSTSNPGTGANAITTASITPTGTALSYFCSSLVMECFLGDASHVVAGTGWTLGASGWTYGGATPLAKSEFKTLSTPVATAATYTDATNGSSGSYLKGLVIYDVPQNWETFGGSGGVASTVAVPVFLERDDPEDPPPPRVISYRDIAGAPAITGFATPSALVGLTAIAGTATTAIRSDGAPALSQSIAPTWTGTHTFTISPFLQGTTSSPSLVWKATSATTDQKQWDEYADTGSWYLRAVNDAFSGATVAIQIDRVATAINRILLSTSGKIQLQGLVEVDSNIVGPNSSFAYTIAAEPNATFSAGGYIQLYGSTSGSPALVNLVSGTSGNTIQITSAGVVVSAGASTPNTMVVNGSAGGRTFTINGASGVNGFDSFAVAAAIGSSPSTMDNGQLGVFYNTSNTGDNRLISLGQVGGAAFIRAINHPLSITASSGTTFQANSGGGETLDVIGSANAYTAHLTAASTTGQSYGLFVQAGTNNTDSALTVNNQANTLGLFNIRGDGASSMGNASGNMSMSSGGAWTFSGAGFTVNPTAVFNGLLEAALPQTTAIGTAAGGLGSLWVYNATGSAGAAMMTFHRGGVYAAYFGLDTDNVLKFGGWSAGAVAWPIAKGDAGTYNMSINATSTINCTLPAGGNVYTSQVPNGTQGNWFSVSQASVVSWVQYTPASNSDYRFFDGTGDVMQLHAGGSVHVSDTSRNLFQAGYVDVPVVSFSGARTVLSTDRGKCLNPTTSSSPITVPSTLPAGSIFTIAMGGGVTNTLAGSGVTIEWLPNNTSGTRTLTGNCLVTVFMITSTIAFVQGSGIT